MNDDGFSDRPDMMFPHSGEWAWRWVAVLFLLGALILGICLGCGSLQASYVQADRATYDAIAPIYSSYVHGDYHLSPSQKELEYRTLRSWKARVEEGERNVGGK